MLGLGLKLLASYLLGSINGALLCGRLRGFDIRAEGSGNAGATNALRTHGLGFALLVAIIDVGKGAAAVAAIAPMDAMDAAPVDLRWVAALCGIAAVVGHIYPFWFDFRGGKGGATAIGALAALAPLALGPVLAVWVAVLVGTGFVSLSTMAAAAATAVWPLVYRPAGLDTALTLYGFAIAALVIVAHRENIARLRRGAEHRMSGVRFWRRQRQ